MDQQKPTGVYAKLMKFQTEVSRLKKDKQNPHFKNSYVDINSVLDEIMPKLSAEDLLVMQPIEVLSGKNYLNTIIYDISDNSNISSSMVLPDNLDAQKTGSALTYFRRYALVSLLCLQAVDDDGKAGSSPVKETKLATEEMILDIESLLKGKDDLRTQWLTYLKVDKFEKCSISQIEKAINQLRSGV